MTAFSRTTLFWTPRVLAMAYIVFLSLFALDVFSEGYGFWKAIAALAIHLIPAFVLIVGLILAWRWEWIGAVLFAGAGGLYIAMVLRLRMPAAAKLNWILTIAGPAFLVSAMFLANWWKRGEMHVGQP